MGEQRERDFFLVGRGAGERWSLEGALGETSFKRWLPCSGNPELQSELVRAVRSSGVFRSELVSVLRSAWWWVRNRRGVAEHSRLWESCVEILECYALLEAGG